MTNIRKVRPVFSDDESTTKLLQCDYVLQKKKTCCSFMSRRVFICILCIGVVAAVGFAGQYALDDEREVAFEQPWFRTRHNNHHKIPAHLKDQSSFGKHFVPENDVFVPPDWSPLEAKYLPCMDRKCACAYYKGKLKGDECYVKNGTTLLKRAVRQELRSLTNEQRKAFEKKNFGESRLFTQADKNTKCSSTVGWMKKVGMYNRLGRVHKYSGVHSGPAFILWHREFIKRMEMVIRRYNPEINMGIPYWDSTLDAHLPDPHDSIIFSEIFLGDVDEKGMVINGPYSNWTTMEGRAHIWRDFRSDKSGEMLNNARVNWLINNDDINMIIAPSGPLTTCKINMTLDARLLEFSHDYVHFFIAGDMSTSHASSNDIAFVLHHSMIDLIFELWRQNKQTRTQRETEYPESDPNCFPFWHNADSLMPMLQPYKVRDALSNKYTDELYEYAPRPTCSSENMDCGSEYLFCATLKQFEAPLCMSKIKVGGDCRGFENSEICYKGSCVEGRCEHEPPEKKQDKLPLAYSKNNHM